MTPKIYLTPQELCNAIYDAVLNAPKPITRLEICRAIGKKKSPHILAMIQFLLEHEFLRAELSRSRQGAAMFLYRVGEREPDCSAEAEF